MSEAKITVAVIIASAIAFVSIGWAFGEDVTRKTWQAECVKRDFAEYNPKTGKWQWKENGKTQPE